MIRRAVPLALGLISVSNPQLNILDTLSKFSHDADAEVSNSYLKFNLELAQIYMFTMYDMIINQITSFKLDYRLHIMRYLPWDFLVQGRIMRDWPLCLDRYSIKRLNIFDI